MRIDPSVVARASTGRADGETAVSSPEPAPAQSSDDVQLAFG
jgi:hypothetical protein